MSMATPIIEAGERRIGELGNQIETLIASLSLAHDTIKRYKLLIMKIQCMQNEGDDHYQAIRGILTKFFIQEGKE